MTDAPKKIWASPDNGYCQTIGPNDYCTGYIRADLYKAMRVENERLRAVLQGIVDLGGTMGIALSADTVDRAVRRALAEREK